MKYQNTVLYFYSIFFINGFCNISHETRPAMQAGLEEHLGTVGMSPHLLLTLFQSGEQTNPKIVPKWQMSKNQKKILTSFMDGPILGGPNSTYLCCQCPFIINRRVGFCYLLQRLCLTLAFQAQFNVKNCTFNY